MEVLVIYLSIGSELPTLPVLQKLGSWLASEQMLSAAMSFCPYSPISTRGHQTFPIPMGSSVPLARAR